MKISVSFDENFRKYYFTVMNGSNSGGLNIVWYELWENVYSIVWK